MDVNVTSSCICLTFTSKFLLIIRAVRELPAHSSISSIVAAHLVCNLKVSTYFFKFDHQ